MVECKDSVTSTAGRISRTGFGARASGQSRLAKASRQEQNHRGKGVREGAIGHGLRKAEGHGTSGKGHWSKSVEKCT